ncbi:MAG: SCP2 sterol-binding domain-containing protein, partial [Candidatus Heimdallarchaeota archaeon]
TREDNIKAFRKWNKTFLYYFTDLDEYYNFTLKDGVPGPLNKGKIDKPDVSYKVTGSAFVGMMRGELDALKAFRKKLVQVKAPIKDLIKLQKLIG